MSRLAWVVAAVLFCGVGATSAQEEPEPLEETASAEVEEAAQDVEGAAADTDGESEEAEEPAEGEQPDEPDEVLDELELPGLPGAAERITFEVPFAVDKGGGSARGSAASLEYLREDYVVASGGVEVTHADTKIQADVVELDLLTKVVTARGNVILDQGPKRITSETLVYDIDAETGKFTDATAYVDPDIYFTGTEIEKQSEGIYVVRDGMVTSCSAEVPVWSFRAGSVRVNVDGYTKVRNTTMRIKKLPILYAPYALYPSNQERRSGFLFPNIGYSDRRGYLLGLAWYQTLGESYDATVFADFYTEQFLGLGTEIRYRPTAGTAGEMQGYAIDDPEQDATRWKATMTHTSNDLPAGLRGVVRVSQVSDFDYFRDFEREFSQISLRRLSSAGYITGNWGPHSFNFVLDELETFIRNGITQTQRQLPEVEYILRPSKLFGLPVYLDALASAHYFQAQRTDLDKVSYGRAHVAPQLTVPLSYWPWLSVSVSGGGRVTRYEDTLTEDRTEFSGEAATRTFVFGDLSIIGPSFSRIFEKKIGAFGKFKHIIEPRIVYDFVGDPGEEQNVVPIFDTIDTVTEQSIVTYSLVNRVLAKPADESSIYGAREIMSFEIGQAYSLNDDQPFERSRDGMRESRKSKIGGRFRFSPSLRTNFEARATYSPLFNDLDTGSISGNANFGLHTVGLTWFARRDSERDITTSHQGRLFGSFQVLPARLRYSLQANYDFVTRQLQHHRHSLQFSGQCWGVLGEFRQLRTTGADDREVRLAISLKNIGTLLDLNGGTREENF